MYFSFSPPFRSVLLVVMASAGASFGQVAISITIERAITGRVEAFLREMGDMFAFVGSQYRVEVGEREFSDRSLAYHLEVGRGLSRIRSGGLSSLLSVIPRV